MTFLACPAHDIATRVAYNTQCDSCFRELLLIHAGNKLSFCENLGDFVYTMTIIPQGQDTIICHYHFLSISSLQSSLADQNSGNNSNMFILPGSVIRLHLSDITLQLNEVFKH